MTAMDIKYSINIIQSICGGSDFQFYFNGCNKKWDINCIFYTFSEVIGQTNIIVNILIICNTLKENPLQSPNAEFPPLRCFDRT